MVRSTGHAAPDATADPTDRAVDPSTRPCREVPGIYPATPSLTVGTVGPARSLARRLAQHEGLTNISFERADAQIHSFETGAYDVVVSQTGAMFFGDPHADFANLRRSPGGQVADSSFSPGDPPTVRNGSVPSPRP